MKLVLFYIKMFGSDCSYLWVSGCTVMYGCITAFCHQQYCETLHFIACVYCVVLLL